VQDDWYSDDPVESPRGFWNYLRNRKGVALLSFPILAGIFYLNSTLAANITINSGRVAEFGQGIAMSTVCDGNVTVTPYAAFTNQGGTTGTFYFSGFKLSNLDVAACNGITFTLRAYDSTTSSSALTLFSSATSASIDDTNTAFAASLGQSGFQITDTSTANSVTARFVSPVALASKVYKITLESSGNGSSSISSVTVSAFTFSSIQAAYRETCGLTTGGNVWCWGQGANGSLGNGSTQDSIYPVQVSGLSNVTMISFGLNNGCALNSGGAIYCWPSVLGDGINYQDTSFVPTQVSGISNAIFVGTNGMTNCAVLSGGTVKCWGYNYWGDAGNGTDGGAGTTPQFSNLATPTLVSGITNAKAAYGGGCALLTTNYIKCWGYDSLGQLGDGNNGVNGTSFSNVPVSVTGISTASSISPGITSQNGARCAVLASGSINCWGANTYGQLGTGVTPSGSPNATPSAVVGITTATQVSTYNNDSCAVLTSGLIKCWGAYGNGMLGTNTNADSNTPITIAGISNATQVSVGDSHICAIITGGQVKCWGDNSYGQFGNGTTNSSATPS
jgi:Regulator of chromosome condensation (RCC1) repeat